MLAFIRDSAVMRAACILSGCVAAFAARAETNDSFIVLARDGATDYVIVTAADATGVDRYAAAELALYLRQMTGAEFPVVSEDAWSADPNRGTNTISRGRRY